MLGFAFLAAVVLLACGLALRSLSRSNERFVASLNILDRREQAVFEVRGAAMRREISARNLVLVTRDTDLPRQNAGAAHTPHTPHTPHKPASGLSLLIAQFKTA